MTSLSRDMVFTIRSLRLNFAEVFHFYLYDGVTVVGPSFLTKWRQKYVCIFFTAGGNCKTAAIFLLKFD